MEMAANQQEQDEVENLEKYPMESPEAQTMYKSLVDWAVKDRRMDILDSRALKHLIHKLNPRFEMPSREYLEEKFIQPMYDNIMRSVKQKLASADWLALTVERWMMHGRNKYHSLTAHFIDPNWSCHSLNIGTFPLVDDTPVFQFGFLGDDDSEPEPMFSHEEKVALNRENLQFVLKQRKLDVGKVTAVVVEDSPEFDQALAEHGLQRVGCFAENLDTAVDEALAEVEGVTQAVKNCRNAANELSSYSFQELEKKQAELNLPSEYLLLNDPTRWETTCHMIGRFFEYREAIEAVVRENKKLEQCRLSDADYTILQNVFVVLAPLAEFAEFIRDKSYLGGSSFLPVFQYIKDLLQTKENDPEMAKKMKGIILEDLVGKYEAQKSDMKMFMKCCVLDPRFKFMAMRPENAELFSKVRAEILTEAEAILLEMMETEVKCPGVEAGPEAELHCGAENKADGPINEPDEDAQNKGSTNEPVEDAQHQLDGGNAENKADDRANEPYEDPEMDLDDNDERDDNNEPDDNYEPDDDSENESDDNDSNSDVKIPAKKHSGLPGVLRMIAEKYKVEAADWGPLGKPTSAAEELEQYLATPDLQYNVDPLKWWQHNSDQFKHVAAVARKYLCIPATRAPGNRIFVEQEECYHTNFIGCREELWKNSVWKTLFMALNEEQ